MIIVIINYTARKKHKLKYSYIEIGGTVLIVQSVGHYSHHQYYKASYHSCCYEALDESIKQTVFQQ